MCTGPGYVAIVQKVHGSLSQLISMLRPTIYGFPRLDVGGEWVLAYENVEGMKCFAVTSGECLLLLNGSETPVRLSNEDLMFTKSMSIETCLASL